MVDRVLSSTGGRDVKKSLGEEGEKGCVGQERRSRRLRITWRTIKP